MHPRIVIHQLFPNEVLRPVFQRTFFTTTGSVLMKFVFIMQTQLLEKTHVIIYLSLLLLKRKKQQNNVLESNYSNV